MKQVKYPEEIQQVRRFPTALSNDKAFKIFLSNLYYQLECNASSSCDKQEANRAFIDILTNKISNVEFEIYSPQFGKQYIDCYTVHQMINNFILNLGYEEVNRLYKEFTYKNDIRKVA